MLTLEQVNYYLANLKVGDKIRVPTGRMGHPCADVYGGSCNFDAAGPPLAEGIFKVISVTDTEITTDCDDDDGPEEWCWDRVITPEVWKDLSRNLDGYIQFEEEEELVTDFEED